MAKWQLQEAKQRFSEVIRAAGTGEAQIITRHGDAVAVVLDINEYRHLRGESVDLMAYLRADPPLTDDLEIERATNRPREIDLVG